MYLSSDFMELGILLVAAIVVVVGFLSGIER